MLMHGFDRCYTLPPPIVLGVEPAFISIADGTVTYISGLNFVNSGTVRVAFVADGVPQGSAESDASSHRIADRAIVVDAKYRSSTSLVCVSPSLTFPSGVDAATVKVYVCLNGMDFDSVALPRQSIKLSVADEVERSASPRGEDTSNSGQQHVGQKTLANQTKAPSIAVALENDQYVVNSDETVDDSARQRPLLDYRVRVYQVPKIVCVRPTDGTYTSHLTFDGSSFTNTGIAIGTFACLLSYAA